MTLAPSIIRSNGISLLDAERAVDLQRPPGDVVQHAGISTLTAAMSLRTLR